MALRFSLNVRVRTPSPVRNVADVNVGGALSVVVTVLSAMAVMGLFTLSRTAPASMSIWGAVMALTVAVSVSFRLNVMEFVPLAVMIPFDSVTPPVLLPDSRM